MPAAERTLLTHRETETSDPEYAHRVLCRSCAGLDGGPFAEAEGFRFTHHATVAPGFAITRISQSTAGHADLVPPADMLVVFACRAGWVELTAADESVRPGLGTPVLLPPDQPVWHLRWDAPVVDVVRVSRTTVLAQAGALSGGPPRDPEFTAMTCRSPDAQRYWAGAVGHVQRDVLSNADAARFPLVLAEAARLLATALVTTFPNAALDATPAGPDRMTGRGEPTTVQRAIAYIEEHAAEPIRVEDIARAARVGVRGLQHAFRRHRGTTPLGLLRDVRLDRAHRDLQAADPMAGDTVAAIAARWGFPHPGRFSVEYRRVHGRSPSRTLRT